MIGFLRNNHMKSLLIIASLLCLSAQASTIDKEVNTTSIQNIDQEAQVIEAVELQKPIKYIKSIETTADNRIYVEFAELKKPVNYVQAITTTLDGKTNVEFVQASLGVVKIGDNLYNTTGSDRTWLINGKIYSQPVKIISE